MICLIVQNLISEHHLPGLSLTRLCFNDLFQNIQPSLEDGKYVTTKTTKKLCQGSWLPKGNGGPWRTRLGASRGAGVGGTLPKEPPPPILGPPSCPQAPTASYLSLPATATFPATRRRRAESPTLFLFSFPVTPGVTPKSTLKRQKTPETLVFLQ